MKVCNWNMRLIHAVIAICGFVVFAAGSAQAQQTISFPDFSSTTGLRINGNAAVANNGTSQVLRLTPNSPPGQDGTAWFATSLPLSQGFSTTFTFQFTNPGGIGAADGIAFVIQNGSFPNTSSGSLAYDPSANGGGIGYQGLTHSVAVEFDTFFNAENNDVSGNEVGIQSCFTAANSANHGLCSIGSPVDPGTGTFHPLINMTDTHVHTAVITYTPPECSDCGGGTLSVTVDTQLVLSAGFNLANLGLDPNGDAFVGFTAATGAGDETQDILSWSFTANQNPQTGTPFNANSTQTFTFNAAANNEDLYTADYSHATELTNPDATPFVSDLQITPADWPGFVTGTPLATTLCIPIAGASGNCAEKKQVCTNSTSSTKAGANCPQSSVRNILLSATFDPVTPIVDPATVFGVVELNDTGACPFDPNSAACPQNGLVSFKGPGQHTGKKGATVTNSTYVFVTKVQPPSTTVTGFVNGAGWTNSPTPSGSFTGNPATLPVPNTNNMVVAPIASITYGTNPTSQPAPSTELPVSGDTTIVNPSACPNPIPAQPPLPPMFGPEAVTLATLPEGSNRLHYFTTDCATTEDLKFTFALNLMSTKMEWFTNFNSLTINVDLTPPTITGLTLSTTTPLPGQQVMATYTCADPEHPVGVASGIATCGPHTSAGTFTDTFTVPTNAHGPQTFSVMATDVAGNSTPASIGYSVDYDFDGFFFPVANAPTVNTIDERSVMPLIFQTERFGDTGVNGLKLVPSGTVSITGTSSSTACPKYVPVSPIVIKSFLNTGLIGLGNGFYVFAWQVNLPRNACIDLSLNLGDGVLHHAIFQAR